MEGMPDIVQQRYEARARVRPALQAYALVDGLQYRNRLGVPLAEAIEAAALFHYTVDAPVADAGPWLVDLHAAQPTHLDALAQLEQACPAVSWIFSELAPDDLARHLRQRLEIGLPDGKAALLRFWDPRVMVGLAQVLTPTQRDEFFSGIDEWHLLDRRERRWIGRA